MRLQYEDGAERLTLAFPNLSRQLKKCAAYILEHPGDVATLSMRQVASRAGVLPSNMNRLARSLGFSGYNEFRDIYRNSVKEISVSYPQKAGQLQKTVAASDFEDTFDTFYRTSVANLDGLFENIDRNSVRVRNRCPGKRTQRYCCRDARILCLCGLSPLRRGNVLSQLASGDEAQR